LCLGRRVSFLPEFYVVDCVVKDGDFFLIHFLDPSEVWDDSTCSFLIRSVYKVSLLGGPPIRLLRCSIDDLSLLSCSSQLFPSLLPGMVMTRSFLPFPILNLFSLGITSLSPPFIWLFSLNLRLFDRLALFFQGPPRKLTSQLSHSSSFL